MTVPVYFREPSSKVSFSFDWFDYAAGAGYKTFYPIRGHEDSGGISLLAQSTSFHSDSAANYQYTTQAGVGSTEHNFDVEFSKPVTVAAAVAYANFYMQTAGGATGRVEVEIFHVDTGASETSIGSELTDNQATGFNYWKFLTISLTKKHFGIGEKLRVEVTITHVAGAGSVRVYHDPAGTYPFVIAIPFIVDL